MQRTSSGFHQDATQEWRADLACGHQQQVRHTPPWLHPSESFRRRDATAVSGRSWTVSTVIKVPRRAHHAGNALLSRRSSKDILTN